MATRRWPLRYGFALLAVAAAIGPGVRARVEAGRRSLLLMAVLLSAWFGGLGPGLSSVALITLLLVVRPGRPVPRAPRSGRGTP